MKNKPLWIYISLWKAARPMTKWSGSSKGMLTFEGGVFAPNFDAGEEDQQAVYEFTRWIFGYRLHCYFERKEQK